MAEVLGEDDEGSIGEIHGKVGVFRYEVREPGSVFAPEVENVESTERVAAEKALLTLGAQALEE